MRALSALKFSKILQILRRHTHNLKLNTCVHSPNGVEVYSVYKISTLHTFFTAWTWFIVFMSTERSTFTIKIFFSVFTWLKTAVSINVDKTRQINHVFICDVAKFLQRLYSLIWILIIFPLVSLFTLPCCEALLISPCLPYVDMKNILGGNTNDSYIHTVSLFVFKLHFPPKSCIKATFSKGRSLAAAFSGVGDTRIYLSCHRGLGQAGMVFCGLSLRWCQVGKSTNIQALYHAAYLP